MARIGATQLSFPSFRGATRLLVLANLVTFFLLLILGSTNEDLFRWLVLHGAFIPRAFLHGWIWQPLTYSFVQLGITSTLLSLLGLWFLAGFLENFHQRDWVLSLYAVSVLATAAAGLVIYLGHVSLGYALPEIPLTGSFGGLFGFIVVIGVLYGDMEFMFFPLPISIKARYVAIIAGLVAIAYLFSSMRMYGFAQLGGALGGYLFIRKAPRRGVSFLFSEKWYGMRNGYYRWKRRRAAKKFEVYMRSQGRTVKFDGSGKQLDEDPDDKKRWN
jgi:membrane associated rhomboid family serine protease